MQLIKPASYYEAIDKIASRLPIGSQMLSAEWLDVPYRSKQREQRRLARDIHAEGSDPIFAVRELLKQARRQVRERISRYERQENR